MNKKGLLVAQRVINELELCRVEARVGDPLNLVIFKKGGEPGDVGINPDHVSFVRGSTGAFTDVFCGMQRIAVEGSFAQVVSKLGHIEPSLGTYGLPTEERRANR